MRSQAAAAAVADDAVVANGCVPSSRPVTVFCQCHHHHQPPLLALDPSAAYVMDVQPLDPSQPASVDAPVYHDTKVK